MMIYDDKILCNLTITLVAWNDLYGVKPIESHAFHLLPVPTTYVLVPCRVKFPGLSPNIRITLEDNCSTLGNTSSTGAASDMFSVMIDRIDRISELTPTVNFIFSAGR